MIRNGIIRNENIIRNEKPGRKILKPDREIRKNNKEIPKNNKEIQRQTGQ